MAAATIMGCGDNQARWSQKAQNLLYDKYGEDFQVIAIGKSYGTFDNQTFTALCAPEARMDCLFEAEIYKDSDYMQDGYVSRKVSVSMEETLGQCLDEMEADYYIHVAPGAKFMDSASGDLSLEEYLSLNPKNKFAVYLAVNLEDGDMATSDAAAAVQEGLSQLYPINGNLWISSMTKREIGEVRDYMVKKARTDDQFMKWMEGGKAGSYQIEDGRLKD